MSRSVVLSGCSGGGKSALLAELARRGHRVIEEPGRRIVVEETRRGGTAVPWIDMQAFLWRVVAMAQDDLRSVESYDDTFTFFDRGLVDAMTALADLAGAPLPHTPGTARAYHRKAFLVPPWPEIYVRDDERRHDFATASGEYARLLAAYPALGYETVILPKVSIVERADLVLNALLVEGPQALRFPCSNL